MKQRTSADYSVTTTIVMDDTQSGLVMCQCDAAMGKQAYQSVTEVGKQQLLIPKAHSQHPVEKFGDSLVLLKHRVHRPANFKHFMTTDITHMPCTNPAQNATGNVSSF